MSQGRRDYIAGFLSETGTGARYTESYFLWYANVIAGAGNTTVYQYTIPTGKKLAINRFIFSSDSPAINRVLFTIDDIIKAGVHFSNYAVYPVSDQNPFYVSAGEVLKLLVYNTHNESHTFYVTIIGCLETL